MKEKLPKILKGEWGNHILPFFWQHGEDDETLLRELHKIYESGIRAVCAEARPAPEFGRDGWYEDMRLILTECRRLGMEFWLLDDCHFPTGQANGLLWEKYPHLGKHALMEQHTDVAGPVTDGAVLYGNRMGEADSLLAVIACERVPDDPNQRLTGRTIDLTDGVDTENGMVFFDLPGGFWRIFTIYDTKVQDKYIDVLREDSVHVLIEAVYQPHYEKLGDFFDGTFRGYFSDEPFIMQNARLPLGDEVSPRKPFPWNDTVQEGLEKAYGENWLTALPGLWFPMEGESKIRVAYMDTVTKLYEKCFCRQLGDWCRSHGVEYIGHIVEDANIHTTFGSGGHYFRALDGQDMAGIDVVLCQIVPGMTHNTIVIPCHYDVSDAAFFHFGLAKLGSSHAHIQPLKKGRAMCEIYGAYGWAEGLPMMKWLTDHMLVRGINWFVPHAFSPRFPDQDCPPHFYAGGHNPEFRPFGTLMGYMNRVSHMLSDGLHHATAALYYHAQAEWSGDAYMHFQQPAQVLTEHQIDFDVIPEDYLSAGVVRDGKLLLNGESYGVFVLPYARRLPADVIRTFAAYAESGLPVWCLDGLPEITCEGDPIPAEWTERFCVVTLDTLAEAVWEEALEDVRFTGTGSTDLRVYHYSRGGCHCLFLTNEGITGPVEGELTICASDAVGEEFIRYDPMANRAYRDRAAGTVPLSIAPYNSLMLLYGDIQDTSELPEWELSAAEEIDTAPAVWRVSYGAPEAYDPMDPTCPEPFGEEEEMETLINILKQKPRYAGFVRYSADVTLPEAGTYTLDLGRVGEVAWVWVNGKPAGESIIPPYTFTIDADAGINTLTVVTTSHLGYEIQDYLSSFLLLEPAGLLGPVKLFRHR